MRYSKQREAVYQALQNNFTHPDVSTVYKEVRQTMPHISLGTVYRNLQELCETGRIKKVSLEDSSVRFEPCTTPHPHFVCEKCGKVLDLPAEDVTVETNVSNVTHTEVVLYGICDNCKTNK